MSKVTCAISGLTFTTSYLESLTIPHTEGWLHPIFSLEGKALNKLYVAHTRGQLTSIDSYLLFCAILQASGKIKWRCPASYNPDLTPRLVENSISQLVSVLLKTDAISHPSFSQPSFVVTPESSDLSSVPNWIKAWDSNIYSFHNILANEREQKSLTEITNKLSNLILGGESPERYVSTIANWADKAAGFPADKAELYKQTIRSCFNMTKMFNTPLALLKEIKEYCESNIDVGSIHFHTLMKVLKEGISRHVDYLGGSSLALGYSLLPTSLSSPDSDDRERIESEAVNKKAIADIVSAAPTQAPQQADYPTVAAFIKAKVAYRIAQNQIAQSSKTGGYDL